MCLFSQWCERNNHSHCSLHDDGGQTMQVPLQVLQRVRPIGLLRVLHPRRLPALVPHRGRRWWEPHRVGPLHARLPLPGDWDCVPGPAPAARPGRHRGQPKECQLHRLRDCSGQGQEQSDAGGKHTVKKLVIRMKRNFINGKRSAVVSHRLGHCF